MELGPRPAMMPGRFRKAAMNDPTPPPSPSPDQELALLRDQLRALAELAQAVASDSAAPRTAPPPDDEELGLLRGLLADLAAWVRRPAPGDMAGGPPWPGPQGTEEAMLLKAVLAALLPILNNPAAADIGTAMPASSAPPAPDLARIEAAITRLLGDLVRETDRRRQAEAEALRARALLRSHGFQDSHPPERAPLSPRPLP